ncbi:indole-3-glycerol phosphate synthase TrpC [bacterium]|nr:indole-3-glycerol phosphate synthase TrpC [bacterium]
MDILNRILEVKRAEVRALKESGAADALREAAEAVSDPPSFYDALAAEPAPRLIAEVKKASPSKGIIREDFNPVQIARQYAEGGASALSVLTDRQFFQGDLSFLRHIREAVELALLRKDFIIDEIQIAEARANGASAILLIAAALSPEDLAALHRSANEWGLDVLLEVHDAADIAKIEAGNCPARIVGINNRNLRTFVTDLAVTEELARDLRERYLLVSESGIFTPEDVERVRQAGARAVLVGESLMRQPDPGVAARELLQAPKGSEQ